MKKFLSVVFAMSIIAGTLTVLIGIGYAVQQIGARLSQNLSTLEEFGAGLMIVLVGAWAAYMGHCLALAVRAFMRLLVDAVHENLWGDDT